MKRRNFLKTTAGAIALTATAPTLSLLAAETKHASVMKLPRWRGFNLLDKFVRRKEGNPPFAESDFALMNEWGFDFARLPMSYLCWAEGDPATWLKIREDELKHIDAAIELGHKHGVHVNLNFHRAGLLRQPAEGAARSVEGPAGTRCLRVSLGRLREALSRNSQRPPELRSAQRAAGHSGGKLCSRGEATG